MSELSNQTNAQLKKTSNARFVVRTIVFVIVTSAYYSLVPEWLHKWLEPAAYTGFIGVWKWVFAPILIAFGLIAVYRTFRRRRPLGYMKSYVAACRKNGFTYCPRCGSDLEERTGKESYRARVGTKVTTTKWSDGSTTKKEEAVYGTKTREYTYFKCTNLGCGLGTDKNHPWKWQMTLPYKTREIEALCTPGTSMPKGISNPESTLQIRVSGIVICLLTLAFMTGSLLFFNDFCDENDYTIEETLTGEATAVVQQVLDAENGKTDWCVAVDEFTMDYATYMTFRAERGATVTRYLQKDGTEVINFKFDGLDLGTGLEGEYDIVTLEGKLSVVDVEEEAVYTEGSDFFKTNYPKLSALTYDSLLTPVTEPLKAAKYGKNNLYGQILEAEGTSLGVYDETRTEIVNQADGLRTRYVVTTENKENPHAYEMGDIRLESEAVDVSDELGQLLYDAGNTTYIDYYKDDVMVCKITHTKNLKEHTFGVEEPYGNLKRGQYRITEGGDTIDATFWDEDIITSTKETLKISENKELYDELMALVPETYLRKYLDLKTADSFNLLGAYTSYTAETDKGGEVKLQVTFGSLNTFVHTIADGERLEYGWA